MSDVRWGIVGTGAMAEQFAKGLLSVKGAVLHAVVSRTRGLAESFAARFGVRQPYRAYADLLADPAIDIVYVATRNEHHHEDTLAAIDAGKGVLCEKPFALNAALGRSVVESARRRGVFCMEAMWMWCSPAAREAIDLVRAGCLGDPRFVSAELGFARQCDPADRVFAVPGGGALYDFGVYALSFVHALFGPPRQISSRACIGPTGVDDEFVALLAYDSGRRAVIAASLRAQLANEAAVYGTTANLDRIAPLFFPRSYRLTRTPITTSRPSAAPKGQLMLHERVLDRVNRILQADSAGHVMWREVPNAYGVEAEVVQRCFRAGLTESPEVPLDDTVAVLESMDAIRCGWRAGE